MTETKNPTVIAIFAYRAVQMSAVLGLGDLFTIANRISGQLGGGQLDIRDVTADDIATGNIHEYDAIILPPNMSQARGQDDFAVQGWLRAQHKSGTIMCSVCAGAFWLGHAGLLDGRPATTHWALEQEFRDAFPKAHLNAEHLLVDDNDIVTAGGLMAWLDLGLFIVNRWLGPQVVSATARHLLIDPSGREQKNYRSFRPPLSHGDGPILEVQHWLEAHVAQDISVAGLSAQAGMSERTFLRKFKAATGDTPVAYIQNLRIEKARGLLERTRIAVSEISWKVGYRDPSAFSRIFNTRTGLTAGAYRKRFGVQARKS